MKEEFRPAIVALETELRDMERKTAETRKMINRLYEISGEAAPYGEVDDSDRRAVGTIRADQFYGKTVTTASREYLEIRKVQNRGPASPREIYDALVEGGFKFDAASKENAITGMRQTLRKNSAVFHRLPNSQYGLLAWYPNAKQLKEGEEGSAKAGRRKLPRKKLRRPKKPASNAKKQEPENVNIADEVFKVMGDGADWTVEQLKQQLPSAGGRRLQGALLSLKSRNLVVMVEKGVWRTVAGISANTESPDESEAAADDMSAAA